MSHAISLTFDRNDVTVILNSKANWAKTLKNVFAIDTDTTSVAKNLPGDKAYKLGLDLYNSLRDGHLPGCKSTPLAEKIFGFIYSCV
jgi:hypothetical protein